MAFVDFFLNFAVCVFLKINALNVETLTDTALISDVTCECLSLALLLCITCSYCLPFYYITLGIVDDFKGY